jgi:ABC-type uncharacterized transport system ATPase subunit
MREGRLVAQGTVADVRGAGGARCQVLTAQTDVAATVLREMGAGEVNIGDGVVSANPGELPEDKIVAALVHAGVGVRGFSVTAPSLEDLFVSLTGEGFDVSG